MKKKKNFSLWLLLFIFLTTFSLDSIEIKTSFFLPIKTIRIDIVPEEEKKEENNQKKIQAKNTSEKEKVKRRKLEKQKRQQRKKQRK